MGRLRTKPSLEIIDEGYFVNEEEVEYRTKGIPTEPFEVIVTKYDNKKNRIGTQKITIKKIKILRNKDGQIFGHLRFM